jgi:hypothetical protein
VVGPNLFAIRSAEGADIPFGEADLIGGGGRSQARRRRSGTAMPASARTIVSMPMTMVSRSVGAGSKPYRP